MLHIFTIICLLFSSLFISPERAMSGMSIGGERVESAVVGEIEYIGIRNTGTLTRGYAGASSARTFWSGDAPFTATNSGTVSKGYYNNTGQTSASNFYIGIYNSDGSTRLGKSDVVSGIGNEIVEFTFSSPVSITAESGYIIAISTSDASDNIASVNYSLGGSDVMLNQQIPASLTDNGDVNEIFAVWVENEY